MARCRKGDRSSTKGTETSSKSHGNPSRLRVIKLTLHHWGWCGLWSGLSYHHLIRQEFFPGLCWKVTKRCCTHCFGALWPRGNFHLPPQLEMLTPAARSCYSAPLCAAFSVLSQPQVNEWFAKCIFLDFFFLFISGVWKQAVILQKAGLAQLVHSIMLQLFRNEYKLFLFSSSSSFTYQNK